MATTDALKPDHHSLPETSALQPGHWRGWLRLLLEAMASALAIALLLAISVLLGATVANAATVPDAGETPAAARSIVPEQLVVSEPPNGTALLIRTPAGFVTAPLQRSDVRLQVTGNIVRARISQTYTNPGDAWLNGRYQFPLPQDAAVDTLRMQVGERQIIGEIQPREQARKTFRKARDNGQRASLIEQHRPNVFTADVANLAPLADITIEIEYQQVLALREDLWELRFPTVVAPRYTPRPRPDQADEGFAANTVPAAFVQTVSTRAEEAQSESQALPEQPTLKTADPEQNRLSLEIELDTGMPISLPVSATHDVAVTTVHDTDPAKPPTYRVLLRGEALADRDFELSWSPQPQVEPQANLQIEQQGQDWYALLTVAPPTVRAESVIDSPREIILVLDTSGSMHGALDDAKHAVNEALQSLRPSDRFNVIEFNSEHSSLFAESREASAQNLQAAQRFLRALRANGGTEMRGALIEAMKSSVPADMISQLIFVTDGAVGNEHELFNLIETMLGNRKLFTVGIGSAPNDYFMRKAAAAGRGSFTFIANTDDVSPRMRALFDKLGSPMLTRLQLRDERGEVVDTGDVIRDLYAGEPVIHTFRLPYKPQTLTIEGEQREVGWQEPLTIETVTDRGIDRLWARDQIATLSEAIRRYAYDGRDPSRLREQATQVAMAHHLVSAYTSLVAVDVTPVRPADEIAADTTVPRHLPKGWKQATSARHTASINGGALLAQTSNGLLWQLLTGAVLLLLAALFVAVMLFRAQALLDQHPN